MNLHERWALHHFEEESVLLDLHGGQYYVLNGTAAVIAGEILAGRPQREIADSLAREFDVTRERAAEDVGKIAAELAAEVDDSEQGPLKFTAREGRLSLTWHGRAIAELSADGDQVTPAPTDSGLELRQRLLAAAPHLLVLQQTTVLHSSCVISPRGAFAFTGASGAGKTTVAHAAARHGAALVSEDLCLLDLGGERPRVLVDGEAHVRRWVETAARAWDHGARALDARPLREILRGESVELVDLVFLDAQRRIGGALLLDPKPPAHVLVALLANAFAELDLSAVWRRVFERSIRLASEVRCSRATLPAGLDALERAMAAWAARGFANP